MSNENTNSELSKNAYHPPHDLDIEGNKNASYKELGDNKIEVIDRLTLPHRILENKTYDFPFYALRFAWWFRLFEQTLKKHSVYQGAVKLKFSASIFLSYSVVLNSSSIENALKQMKDIHNEVQNKLLEELEEAQFTYNLFSLDDLEDDHE